MALVKFYRGNKEKYNATKYLDGIYFSLDTKEIIVNNVSYGYQGNAKEIQQVEYTAPNTIKIIYNDSSEHKVILQDARAGTDLDTSRGGLMTKEMAYKLGNIEEGANRNTISTISVDDEIITPVAKKVNINLRPLRDAILRNRVIAKDNSVEVVQGSTVGRDSSPAKVGVKLATDSGLQVTEEGLKVIGSGVSETYTGDDKAIVVDSTAVGGKKKVSLKVDTKANNILTTSANGAYASVKLKKLDVPTSENEVSSRYGLIKVAEDGTESTLEGATIDVLKDKFLKNVEVGKIPDGQPGAGKDALKFSFVIGDGTTVERYVILASLLSGIQTGDGLEINGSGKITVKLSEKEKQTVHGTNVASLAVDESGLYIEGLLESIQELSPSVESVSKDIIGVEVDESVPDEIKYKISAKDIAKASKLTELSTKVESIEGACAHFTTIVENLSNLLEWQEAN